MAAYSLDLGQNRPDSGSAEVGRSLSSVGLLDGGVGDFVAAAHGLPPAVFYVMSFLEADDGATWWMPRRAYYQHATRSLHVPEAGRGRDFVHAPEAKAGYAGPVHHVREADRWTVAAPDGSTGLEVTSTFLSWTERGLVSVAGSAVGPACRLRLDDPDHPLLYTTRPFRLAGTVKGVAVRGAGLLVAMHMPEGTDIVASPLVSRQQVAWVEFVNEHADGSFENGLLVCGREHVAGLALSRGDGARVAASELTVQVETDGDVPEFSREIRFCGGGETIVWKALPTGGRWPLRGELPDGYRFRQGVVHRESAPPVVASYAFAETFQDRMVP